MKPRFPTKQDAPQVSTLAQDLPHLAPPVVVDVLPGTKPKPPQGLTNPLSAEWFLGAATKPNSPFPMNAGDPEVVDVLPGVSYGDKTFEPGAVITPERVTLVPTLSGPSLEALAERREQLRANLYHAKQSMKSGTDDARAISCERALHAFDASGDGCRLHIVARRALRESPWAEKTFAKEIHDLLNCGSIETAMLKLKEYLK